MTPAFLIPSDIAPSMPYGLAFEEAGDPATQLPQLAPPGPSGDPFATLAWTFASLCGEQCERCESKRHPAALCWGAVCESWSCTDLL